MSGATQLAAGYFAPPSWPVWNWEEAGDAIAWRDGGTAAFRRELRPVLDRLTEFGLPPFSALVYLLGACRERWPDSAGRAFLEQCSSEGTPFREALTGLDRIYAARATVRNRLPELAEMLSLGCGDATSPCEAAHLLAELANESEPCGWSASELHGGSEAAAVEELRDSLSPLRSALAAWSEPAFEEFLRVAARPAASAERVEAESEPLPLPTSDSDFPDYPTAEQAGRAPRVSHVGLKFGARGRAPELIGRMPLIPNVEWESAVVHGDTLLAVGREGCEDLVAQWVCWREPASPAIVGRWPLGGREPGRVEPVVLGPRSIHIEGEAGMRFTPRLLTPSLAWRGLANELMVGSSVRLPARACAAAWDGETHVWSAVREERSVRLFEHGEERELSLRQRFMLDSGGGAATRISILAPRNVVLLGAGPELIVYREGNVRRHPLGREILSLPRSSRCVAAHPHGGLYLRTSPAGERFLPVAEALAYPRFALPEGGWLAAAGEERLLLHRTFPRFEFIAEHALAENPFALLAPAARRIVAVCGVREICLFRLPA